MELFKKITLFSAVLPVFTPQFELNRFYRGNTNTHTNLSDGAAEPKAVVKKYKELGYDFIILTDTNRVDGKESELGDGHFLVIPGEEVTYSAKSGHKNVPVHVNALFAKPREAAGVAKRFADVDQALDAAVEFARKTDGALPQINHPNYDWSLSAETIQGLEGVTLLMEIANQNPLAKNKGAKGHPSTEAIWDDALSDGDHVFGVASDELRSLNDAGRGWVQVAAENLTPSAIREALSTGRFYASTGVTIEAIKVVENTMTIRIAHPRKAETAQTEFVGDDGEVLARVTGFEPVYRLGGGVSYVRARIRLSGGAMAWTQPAHVKK